MKNITHHCEACGRQDAHPAYLCARCAEREYKSRRCGKCRWKPLWRKILETTAYILLGIVLFITLLISLATSSTSEDQQGHSPGDSGKTNSPSVPGTPQAQTTFAPKPRLNTRRAGTAPDANGQST